jgi:hypothetical protein
MNMRGRRILRVLKVVAIVILAFTVFGFVVTQLWNYLMPGLFGLRTISFWQAVGLMLLGRLLFGGFRPGRGGFGWRGEMMKRWGQMTPEEREKFREGMRGRCGQPRTAAPEPNRGPAV